MVFDISPDLPHQEIFSSARSTTLPKQRLTINHQAKFKTKKLASSELWVCLDH
jgi:hypothetical protein